MADDLLAGSGAQGNEYNAASIEVLEGLEPVRKRPGMYIGGTDERALHHMVAEILDNSMDEAVAGHANRIEVELHEDYSVTVRDNGRGIPVDPHPKFPDKSALEVILCTLHAGGKFSNKAYSTSGGLNGVGSSVVNALSDLMRVEVARNRELYVQSFSRGVPQGPVQKVGAAPNRKGTSVTFHPDAEIFGSLKLKPARLFKMVRSKAYLFSGVEIRWKTAIDDGETPAEATFKFPGGLADYLADVMKDTQTYADKPFAGKVSFEEKFNVPGSVEWAINWSAMRDGFILSYTNTVPTPEGGTHEAGFWAAVLKGVKTYGERVNNRKAKDITREDLLTGGCALLSIFIREPSFVGQTKDRLSTEEAAKWVELAVRDHFDNWLAADPKSAREILDFLVLRAEERLRRRQEKETQRKSATKRLRLPGKLTDCSAKIRDNTELFLVEGDSAGGSAKGARSRETQAILPLRGKVLNVMGAAAGKLNQNQELSDICEALGVQMGAKFNTEDLRYQRIIIMTDADVDGAHIASLLMTFFFTQMRPLIEKGHLFLACPPLYRLTQGANRLYVADDAEKEYWLQKGLGGRGKIDVQRFKGLGEMDAKDLKETTMDPKTRKLIRVTINDDEPGETSDLVERLMGKKPELRFQYIQENARFVEELDV
ncbi:DNA topoisomerase IV subunit B [Ketogulonicigenium vulgare]|uniref:DNA topoisomerase 4 subunit B n=1 Tax=Ketogulonicigenium vulgare (strain WSH-001) TaxID=759362 RepID=F9Y3I8_KETVW|nr:DNA topoisomerase IV subunit B [Ketogulonicigenium vulgare]ADO43319.1 DNA topoisomerase IV, B subunit [Ketogulonicigenium vulgare Y25]AEM41608.1 DNA gyrase subunit b [Ketogulonicigenium vulgare WSH-001]ALJ81724.1 DNA topoisomerase IV subunit B [Ketogulonicigenium vulgare]ANW34388.1 DNA topoisomerase IV subunit B [Ketogulonicigenium vulgare]AOZ55358.1 DNA topoisomerase IV, B subunit [Ketogulonicigenium vulgare]